MKVIHCAYETLWGYTNRTETLEQLGLTTDDFYMDEDMGGEFSEEALYEEYYAAKQELEER